jgi:hypothetical protein
MKSMNFRPKVAALDQVRLEFAEADEDDGLRDAIRDLKQKSIEYQRRNGTGDNKTMVGEKRLFTQRSDQNPEEFIDKAQLKKKKIEQR